MASKFQLPLFAGVDVGGTNIKVGIVDDRGQTVGYKKFQTRATQSPQPAIARANETLRQIVVEQGYQWSDVAGTGLGTPGSMDIPAGVMLEPHNLPGWWNFKVRDELAKHVEMDVTYANDAAAAGFGEYWIGTGRRYKSMVLITLGTGVGGSIIVDEINIEGANSGGAEIGHIAIDSSDDARACPCGHAGHLESYASATGVVGRCDDLLSSGRTSVLNDMIGAASPLSALMISNAADEGDELALEIVMDTARYLGRGIAIVAQIIDPAVFILGGAMNFGGDQTPVGRRFLDETIAAASKLVFSAVAENMDVQFAKLGGDAGYIGAAGLARTAFLKQS